MLGETAANNSLKNAADEIARWINDSANLGDEAKILIVDGNPLADSNHYMLLINHLAMLETDAANQKRINSALLNPSKSKKPLPLPESGKRS